MSSKGPVSQNRSCSVKAHRAHAWSARTGAPDTKAWESRSGRAFFLNLKFGVWDMAIYMCMYICICIHIYIYIYIYMYVYLCIWVVAKIVVLFGVP